MIRSIGGSVFVQWETDGSWTNESSNFLFATGQVGQTTRAGGPLGVGLGQVGTAQIVMYNSDGRYSPDNTDSPISASISGGQIRNRKIRIEVGVDTATCTIFTGYIRDPLENALENTVSWDCEDRGALLADLKLSTCLMQDRMSGSYASEILRDAGLTSSDYSVDKGYSRIAYTWMDDESIWQELGLAAEVEGGRVYVDRFGVVHFEDSAAMILGASILSVTLNESQVSDFTPRYDWKNHFNRVQVKYTGRRIGAKGIVFDDREYLVIHPNETITHEAKLDQPTLSVDTPVVNVDYFARSSGGIDTSGSLTLTMSTCAQKAKLTLQNTGSMLTTFLTGLQLVGLPIIGRYEAIVAASSACSIVQYQEQTMEFPPNPLVQDRIHARFMAEYLSDRMESPRRVITLRGVPGSVNAMPGAKIEYSETTRTQVSGSGFIINTNWELGAGFVMNLDVVTSDLFVYGNNYFVLDETQLDSGSRLWY